MGFFISESINSHGKKPHAFLEIVVYMCSRSAIYVELPFPKRLLSGLVGRQRAEPVSNNLEALFDSLGIVTARVQRVAS
jgi:hypothetical protein